MGELWGEVAPVPEERITALTGGETVEGFRVAYTPGHASHHVSYLHEDSGDAYVGDVAGVRIPPYDHTIAPTPPPDIDVEAWLDSLHTLEGWNPQSLCLTHFGRSRDVADQLAPDARRARRHGRLAPGSTARSASSPRLRGRARRRHGPRRTVRGFEQAAPPDQLYLGLERYWRKKAE